MKGPPPRRERLGMGELEARVLDVLWDAEGQLTPAEVNARLDSDRQLAYTTVMAVLVRLFEKGNYSGGYGPWVAGEEVGE